MDRNELKLAKKLWLNDQSWELKKRFTKTNGKRSKEKNKREVKLTDVSNECAGDLSESLAPPLCFGSAGREKRKGPMISAGDAEFPRDYHPLAASGGRRGRQFPDNSNGGFASSSPDRRHNSVAAKSLEALNNIHKADIERQRDALMDFQKSKYSNSPGGGGGGGGSQGTAAGRQVRAQQHAALWVNAGGTSAKTEGR